MMFGSIRQKQLNATTVLAVLALVFAMTGGAWAAKKFIITSTSQISPSVLKKLKGATGAKGAPGTPGAAGPAGPTGPSGPQGGVGTDGKEGQQGKEGLQGKEGPPGAKGANGKNGEPWTPNSELPEKATETGTWGFGPVEKSGSVVIAPVASFTIKLKAALAGASCGEIDAEKHVPATCKIHFINAKGEEEPLPGEHAISTACLGTPDAPTAAPGNLCVYTATAIGIETGTLAMKSPGNAEAAAGITGAILEVITSAPNAQAHGTWAVTG